ncbi:MAG TPA: hypothetical protein VE998_06825, partial [Terriglobales bacterium]|nr:hypothetical protein [Terriglobales bacterium]
MGAFAAVFALVAALPAQPAEPASDQHLSDPAAALYQRSPFAHGYIHGYEEGFHVGDQDLQFGRLTRGDRRKTSAGHPRPALRGESASFREGYDQGFTAGYRDSVAGREFRAIAALRQAAAALGEGARAQDDGGFDAAFMTGYFAGE